MGKRVYIAYGSNMNMEQMQHRCRHSHIIAKGYLNGYELNFCGNRAGNNYATVIKKEGAKTPILVWVTSRVDELNLDCYEGYPTFYRKETISPTCMDLENILSDDDLFIDEAYIYIMNSDHTGLPSRHYLMGIADAYREFGFDLKYLQDAIARIEKA